MSSDIKHAIAEIAIIILGLLYRKYELKDICRKNRGKGTGDGL